MPFYDDIDQFITTCYKNVGKNNRTIVLSNTSGDFIRNNIGQVHHFTSMSLHHILSSQQKNYDIFSVDEMLGFVIY